MRSFEALVPWFSSGSNRRMASDSLKSSKDQCSGDLSIILELFRINFGTMHASNSRITFMHARK